MKRQTIPNAGEDSKQLLLSLLVGMQNGMATLENSLGVFINLSYDRAIPLLREMKTYTLTKT